MTQSLPEYEIKDKDSDYWEKISEVDALKILHDNFERIAPKISDMLQGKEIETFDGIFRIV